MANLGAVFGLLGLLAIIVGLVLFIPIPAFKARRRAARWLSLGGLASFIVGIVISPSQPQANKEQVASAKGAPASSSPSPTAAASTSAVTKKQIEAEAKELWASIIRIDELCSDASKKVAKASGAGDIYEIYPAAKHGSEACSSASTDTDNLLPPASLDGEKKNAFQEAIQKCSQAQMLKSTAYSKLAEVVDGNTRPSAVTEVKEYLETAQSGGLYCAAGFFEAAAKADIDIKIFKAR